MSLKKLLKKNLLLKNPALNNFSIISNVCLWPLFVQGRSALITRCQNLLSNRTKQLFRDWSSFVENGMELVVFPTPNPSRCVFEAFGATRCRLGSSYQLVLPCQQVSTGAISAPTSSRIPKLQCVLVNAISPKRWWLLYIPQFPNNQTVTLIRSMGIQLTTTRNHRSFKQRSWLKNGRKPFGKHLGI